MWNSLPTRKWLGARHLFLRLHIAATTISDSGSGVHHIMLQKHVVPCGKAIQDGKAFGSTNISDDCKASALQSVLVRFVEQFEHGIFLAWPMGGPRSALPREMHW